MSRARSRRLAGPLACVSWALVFIAQPAGPVAESASPQQDRREEMTDEQRAEIRRLESIGYVGTTEAPVEGPTGVVIYDEDRAQPGINFFTSGHAPDAFLIDMQGEVLHRWTHRFEQAFPDANKRTRKAGRRWWRRAHLLENGDLIAIFEGQGLIKLNKDSELIWASRIRAHHDLKVTPDGKIYVLTREASVAEYRGAEQAILQDFVSILDADGTEIRRISLLEALENSAFASIPRGRTGGDIFHTNSLSILDGSIADDLPAFRRGNILTSFRVLNAIAVLDLERELLVWVHATDLVHQHDPELLPNGNIMIFDNRTETEGSRVIELDPVTRSIAWQYSGTDDEPFFSRFCGAAQRLANGNTLITESGGGRAFEVTPEKKTVWEYRNPYGIDVGRPRASRLAEVLRLPRDYTSQWLTKNGD